MIKVDSNLYVINFNKVDDEVKKIIGERVCENQINKSKIDDKKYICIEDINANNKEVFDFFDGFNIKDFIADSEAYVIRLVNLNKKEQEKIIELYYK